MVTAAPSAAVASAVSPAVPDTFTLPNGLRVVLLPDDLAPVAETMMVYHAGADDEAMPGLAHAVEHMLFRGTTDVSSAQFAAIANRAGAQYNASTTNQYTEFHFELPSAYLPIALRLEADRMTNATISPSAWATERGAIEQEVRAHESSPFWKAQHEVLQGIYGNSPLAHTALGTVPGFQKMTAADIARFYHTWYHPNDATLVVAGDFDSRAVRAEVAADFGPIPAVPLPPRAPFTVNGAAGTTFTQTIQDFPLPIAVLGYRLPGTGSPAFAEANVLQDVFGDDQSAFGDLAADGKLLASFFVASGYPQAGGFLALSAGTPGSTAASVDATLGDTLAAYRKTGVPANLVDAAKQRILSGFDYKNASIPGLLFSWLQSDADGVTPARYAAEIAAVTPQRVDALMNRLFLPQNRVALELRPSAGASATKTAGQVAENVQIAPDPSTRLPAWTLPYFRAPLSAPHSDADVRTFQLPNGLRVTVRRESVSPTVTVAGFIRTAPDLYVPRGKDGVSGITAGLLTYGTTTYDRKAFAAAADAISATIDLGSDFGVTAQAKHFDRAVALLADGMLHPAFPATAFRIVQAQAAKTVAAVQAEPRFKISRAEIEAIYPAGDPRRRYATAASIDRLTLADVKDWYRFAYRPDETTIAIVGDVDPVQAERAIANAFGSWRAAGKRPSFRYPAITGNRAATVSIVDPNNTQSQVELSEVLKVHEHDAQAIPLLLAQTLLSGEGTGSLLFRNVRTNDGLVYSIDSSMDLGRTSSTFSIDFAADAKNVDKAQAAALAVIRRLQTDPPSVEELQRAKAQLLAQRVIGLDSYPGIAEDILGWARARRTAAQDYAYWKALLATTPAQVQTAMRQIDPKHFLRVIVAPGKAR